MCNDFSIGPDKALYISDTTNSKIATSCPPVASTAQTIPWKDRALYGIDESLS